MPPWPPKSPVPQRHHDPGKNNAHAGRGLTPVPLAKKPDVVRPQADPPSPAHRYRGTDIPFPPKSSREIRTPEQGDSSSQISREVHTETRPSTKSDREERIVCSFPGVLKVLIPEEAFIPFPVAVRVCNLSAGGALVEAHDAVKINPDRLLTNRYFELKVAHVDIPDLRGKIAWTDFSNKNPRLGLTCFERVPALESIVSSSESSIQWEGPPPLPTPSIDPFPPTTRDSRIVITGRAPEGLEVIVKRDTEKFVADVKQGIFRIVLDMIPETENQFLLRSVAGERRSRAVPIHVVYERGIRSRQFFFDVTLDRDRDNGSSMIHLDFQGSVRQAERVLYRFSQLMVSSEKVMLNAELTANSDFDRRLFETLKAEGAVLAADSTQNQAAAKLLDELL